MRIHIGGLVLFGALGVACSSGGGGICKNDVDLSAKAGDCTGVSGRVLGDSATCSTRVSSCSSDEQTTITSALDCYSKLPTCAAATQADWQTQQATCGSGLAALSQGCKDGLFGGVIPGIDGGSDGGTVDAGRQPIDDGGNGISLIAVADERSFAFAWVPLQPSGIQNWELNVFDAGDATSAGTRLPEVAIAGGATRVFEQTNVGEGVGRRFYIAGLDSTGALALGFIEDAGVAPTDAGMCTAHTQCTATQVCDLGTCKEQTCQMSTTCPQPDYICNVNLMPSICERTGGTMMGIDAGMMTVIDTRLPMVSQSAFVKTGPQQFSQTFIGNYQARRPDLVAIDSARQFVAMEQGGVPVGHFTVARGKDYVLDQKTASVIDTVGSNVKVAFNAESQVIYACYEVGRGVRVRRSRDYGKTWGTGALTLEPEDDGGTSSQITDCDIAAWKNGTALLVTVDDGQIVTRQINEILAVNGTPDVAFVAGPTDGGGFNVFNPRRPSIATLPSADIVHIGFTGTRIVSGLQDSDIFGVYRDTTSGGVFSNPLFINAPGSSMGSTFSQDGVSVAIDPVTRRGIAVWTSLENTGTGQYTTVYLGFFNNSTKRWITGSDLSVFMQFGGNYPLFPQRTTGQWDSFSPNLGVMRDGRVMLMFLAGERNAPASDIYPWMVEFALDAGSPVGGAGWFKPPAAKMSETKVVDPHSGGTSVPFVSTAFAADSQISVYGVTIEAIGTQNSEENRGIFIRRP